AHIFGLGKDYFTPYWDVNANICDLEGLSAPNGGWGWGCGDQKPHVPAGETHGSIIDAPRIEKALPRPWSAQGGDSGQALAAGFSRGCPDQENWIHQFNIRFLIPDQGKAGGQHFCAQCCEVLPDRGQWRAVEL